MNQPMDPQRLIGLLAAAANDVPVEGDAMSRIGQGIVRRRRARQLLTVAGSSLAVVAVVVIGFALGPHHSTSAPPPAASPTPVSSPTPGSSPTPLSTPTVAPSLALPAGFEPLDVYASGQSLWLISRETVLSSSDAGATFSQHPAPSGWKEPIDSGYPAGAIGIFSSGGAHGYAWAGKNVWETLDNGASWNLLAGSAVVTDPVLASARSGRFLFLLNAPDCGPVATCPAHLNELGDSSQQVSVVTPPHGATARAVTAAVGSVGDLSKAKVWVLSADGGGASAHIQRSDDGGKSFAQVGSVPGCLTGALTAANQNDLLLICVTGNSSHLVISNDGGYTFRDAPTTATISAGNCASVAWAGTSGNAAVYSPGNGVYWTSSPGADWAKSQGETPTNCARLIPDVSDSPNVYATDTSDAGKVRLWVSYSSGRTWTLVSRSSS